jgi:hypothetical protein
MAASRPPDISACYRSSQTRRTKTDKPAHFDTKRRSVKLMAIVTNDTFYPVVNIIINFFTLRRYMFANGTSLIISRPTSLVAVATYANSVTCSSKLRHVSRG